MAKETTTAAPSGDDGMQIDRADDHHDKDNQQAQGTPFFMHVQVLMYMMLSL